MTSAYPTFFSQRMIVFLTVGKLVFGTEGRDGVAR